MSKPSVFLTRRILDSGMELVQDFCETETWPGELPPNRAEFLRHVHGRDGMLCLLTDRIDSDVMEAAGPGLKGERLPNYVNPEVYGRE